MSTFGNQTTSIPAVLHVQYGVNAYNQVVPMPVAITIANPSTLNSGISSWNTSNLPLGGNFGGGYSAGGNISFPLSNFANSTIPTTIPLSNIATGSTLPFANLAPAATGSLAIDPTGRFIR